MCSGLARSVLFFVTVYIVKISTVTKLLSFLFSEDSRLIRNALIKTLQKLASPQLAKNIGFHISYAMAFGGLRDSLDAQQEIPGFSKVCFCYGFEVCVALGKGKHDYNGLVRD